MALTASTTALLKKDGSVISAQEIAELKRSLTYEIVVKGEAEEEAYRDAIKRWNLVFISESVCHL